MVLQNYTLYSALVALLLYGGFGCNSKSQITEDRTTSTETTTTTTSSGSGGSSSSDNDDDDSNSSGSTAVKLTLADCVDPDLDEILSGVTITLCDGTEATGTAESRLPDCSSDGDSDCTATASYPAVDSSSITASDVPVGKTVGGISGTKRNQIVCKNGTGIVDGAEASAPGDSTTPWGGVVSGYRVVDIVNTSTTVTAGSSGATNFTTYLAPGDIITIAGESRTVASITDASNLEVTVAFTTTATDQAYTYYSPNSDNNVDDFQNDSSPRYTGSGASNCSPATMSDVTGADPLLPDDSLVPNGGNYLDWTNIYQDEQTGLYFTNVLNTGMKFTEGIDLCDSLNGSTAGDGWHVPSKKEFLQLITNGLGEFASGAFEWRTYWTSTTVSGFPRAGWYVTLYDNANNDHILLESGSKGNASDVFCVRE